MMTSIGKTDMSWINDITYELRSLDLSKNNLRKFGIVIGTLIIIIASLFYYRHLNYLPGNILSGIGGILILSGWLKPDLLAIPYKLWMGLAFGLGWIASRVILTFLFFFIFIPLGFIAKIFGKEFLDLKFRDKNDTYWIRKDNRNPDYTKMF